MAYVTARNGGSWELRESHSTPKGPRSRTLASFRTLSDETIKRAQARATKPLKAEDLRAAAHRAGAPVDLPRADNAAGDLLRELAAGRKPSPLLRRLLVDALQTSQDTARFDESSTQETNTNVDQDADVVSLRSLDNAHASAAWLTATSAERGEALRDLLLLADRFPRRPDQKHMRFPRLDRAAA